MPLKLTPQQAKALGIGPKKARTTRKAIKGEPYWSQCKTCAAEFTTVKAEDDHLAETSHPRYEILKGA